MPTTSTLRERIAKAIYASDWPNGRWEMRPAENHERYLVNADAVLAMLPAPADRAAASGVLAWRDVLLEEVHEALAESDQDRLRAELLQVAAVCAAWISDIDSRPTAS